MIGEPKVCIEGPTTSSVRVFWWAAPEPVWAVQPGGEGVAPTLTIYHPTLGETTLAMTAMWTPRVIVSVADDRKTLGLATTNSVTPIAGQRFGAGWIVTQNDGYFDVTVRRLTNGGTAILAEPIAAPIMIPGTSDVSFAPTLNPQTWIAVLSTAFLATTARDVMWAVDYRAQFGRDLAALPARSTGLMHFVRRPFETGVTSQMLSQMFPGLGSRQPRRQGNWDAQIELAEQEIILRLRADMLPRGLTEDDISGARLRLAHATLAAAYVYDETEPAKADALRTRALGRADPDTGRRVGGLVDEALRAVGLDAGQDGDVAVTATEGDRVTDADVGGYFTSSTYTSSTRRFSIGEAH